MGRDLVLLFDGTSNQIAADRTNILRLYGALRRSDEQIVFYDPGVGTLGVGRNLFNLSQKLYEFAGLAVAVGLDDNVLEGYRFLVEHWRPGDRISIFGFSRGAYTARVLAGFLRAFGLVEPHQLNLLPYAYRAFKRVDVDAANRSGDRPGEEVFALLRLHERTIRARRAVPVHFLGLFDTVATVFVWKRGLPRMQYLPFTRNNSMARIVRHAVAIDERRSMFQPYRWEAGQNYYKTPWPPKPKGGPDAHGDEADDASQAAESGDETQAVVPQDFEEVWFAGTHGDVGGGWPEAKSGLAKIPLVWMIEEAQKAGLGFKTETLNSVVKGLKPGRDGKAYERANPCADINNSMIRFWPLVELIPRRRNESTTRKWSLGGWYLPLGERRRLPEDAILHDSVATRLRKRADYDPPNIPGALKAARRGDEAAPPAPANDAGTRAGSPANGSPAA